MSRKPPAKVADITEQSDQLAHKDLRVIAAAFVDTDSIAGPYGLARPYLLSRILLGNNVSPVTTGVDVLST